MNVLLLICESISTSYNILHQVRDSIIRVLLPVLLQKTTTSLGSTNSAADIRFLALKIFTDIVIQFMNDETVYDPKKEMGTGSAPFDHTGVALEPSAAQTTRLLSDLL